MKRITQIFAFFGLSTLLSSCGGSRMDASAPAPKDWLKAPASPPSLLVLPIEIQLSDLSYEFDRRFPSLISQQTGLSINSCPTSSCIADFKLLRKGPLQLSPNPDGSLNIVLPVRLEGQVAFSQNLGFTTVNKTQAFAGEMSISLCSRLGINSDWSLKSNTLLRANFSQAVLPIELPMVGTLNLNIQPILEPIMKKVLEKKGPEIDKMIAERFSLKPFAVEAWQKIQQSQEITIMGNPAWLSLKPTDIYFQTPKLGRSSLQTALGLKGNTLLSLGEKPTPISSTQLPQLQVMDQLQGTLQVHLPLQLPYTQLSKIANQQLAAKVYDVDGRKVGIKAISMSGLGEQLLLKIEFTTTKPSAEGSAFVLATPKFDPQTQMLELDQVKLSTETNSMLLNTATWLAGGFFENKIRESAKFDLKKQFVDLQTTANQLLNNQSFQQISPAVKLSGQLKSLELKAILPEPKGLQILMNAQGILSVHTQTISK